ncbi:MAG: AhpC/TSA family protein [Cytophagaceae bacterium]|jgi:hypothetical protein|nr:AhpC/TSA family protein [Cytophagaceae bacterium]
MKKIFWLSLAVVLMAGCSDKNSLTIEGNISDAGNNKIFLYQMALSGDVLIDSLKVKSNGNFKFKLDALGEPAFFKLQLSPNSFITLLGDTTEHITVKGQKSSFAKNYAIEGSQGSANVKMLNGKIIALRTMVDSLTNIYNSLPDTEKEARAEAVSQELEAAIGEYKKWIGEFVLANTRSFASYYALFLTLSDNTPVMNIWDKNDQMYFAASGTSLNMFYPQAERVKQLCDMVLAVKAEQRKSAMLEKLTSEANSAIPEIKEKDVNGNEIALSSLHGKVVLLSFCATWDEASRQENRNLKRIYNKYRQRGFEIYQVYLERSKVLWESMLLQDEIPWISVTDLAYTNSYPARLYNVQKIPANYLISRDGDIIGKDLFNDMLDDKLRQLL